MILCSPEQTNHPNHWLSVRDQSVLTKLERVKRENSVIFVSLCFLWLMVQSDFVPVDTCSIWFWRFGEMQLWQSGACNFKDNQILNYLPSTPRIATITTTISVKHILDVSPVVVIVNTACFIKLHMRFDLQWRAEAGPVAGKHNYSYHNKVNCLVVSSDVSSTLAKHDADDVVNSILNVTSFPDMQKEIMIMGK